MAIHLLRCLGLLYTARAFVVLSGGGPQSIVRRSTVSPAEEMPSDEYVLDAMIDEGMPPPMSPKEMEAIWRSHSKPLLRVGAKGVQPSHRNSLNELLKAHGYVCVKLNVHPNFVEDTAESLRSDNVDIFLRKDKFCMYTRKANDK